MRRQARDRLARADQLRPNAAFFCKMMILSVPFSNYEVTFLINQQRKQCDIWTTRHRFTRLPCAPTTLKSSIRKGFWSALEMTRFIFSVISYVNSIVAIHGSDPRWAREDVDVRRMPIANRRSPADATLRQLCSQNLCRSKYKKHIQ
jgi:hypothetical protein